MRVLRGCRWPYEPVRQEHGRHRAVGEPEFLGFGSRTGEVLDRDGVGGRVLSIVETRNANDSVAVRASRIAAEGGCELLQHQLLRGKVEALHRPEHLVLARRSSDDGVWLWNRIGSAKRSDTSVPIRVDVQVQMPDFGDAFFGAPAAARAKRIGSHIHIHTARVLMSKPPQIGRCRCLFQAHDPLHDSGRHFTAKQHCDRLSGMEATGKKVGGDLRVHCGCLTMLEGRLSPTSRVDGGKAG